MLLSLPDELLLVIVQHLCYLNHVDLAPFGSACRRLRALVSDRTVWRGAVHLLGDSATCRGHLSRLQGAHDLSRTTSITMTMSAQTAREGRSLLSSMMQKTMKNCKTLQVYAPAAHHADMIKIIYTSPSSAWETCILRDAHETGLALEAAHKPAFLSWLAASQQSLQTLDLQVCPLDWLLGPQDNANSTLVSTDIVDMSFPCLESLSMALVLENDTSATQQAQFWRQCKMAFPNLQHLTLHVNSSGQHTVEFLKRLFADPTLYPWIKTLTVVSPHDLRAMVNKQELCQALTSIVGLYRVNMGWDMVALDAL